jgi:hypothetical protein
MFPEASIARTENVCLPSFFTVTLCGDEHGLNGRLSILHSKRAPASSTMKRKTALRLAVFFFGPLVIVVSGAVVSVGSGSGWDRDRSRGR